MNLFELEEMQKRFPIIEHLTSDVSAVDIDRIEVKEMSVEILSYMPHYSGATGVKVGIDKTCEIHFINDVEKQQPGKLEPFFLGAVKKSGHVIHNEAHSDDEDWEGETVIEAIHKLLCPEKVIGIVKERRGYKIRDHYSVGGLSYTIYLPTKGNTISDYMTTQETTAREQIKESLSGLSIPV